VPKFAPRTFCDLLSRFNPVAVRIVGGKFDPAMLTLPFNIMPCLKQMPPSDIRDLPAVHAWTKGLAEEFETVPA
jgi:hypothetical protein